MSIKLNILSFMTCQQNCFSFNLHHTSMVKFMNLLLYCLNLLCILGTICQMLLYIHIYIYIYIYICVCIIYIYTHVDIHTHIHPPMLHIVIPCSIGGHLLCGGCLQHGWIAGRVRSCWVKPIGRARFSTWKKHVHSNPQLMGSRYELGC